MNLTHWTLSAFASTAIITTLAPCIASAQAQVHAQAEAPAAAPIPESASNQLLGEVVVTATRRSDTVSHVPLSISAETQESLDKQGVKNITDLARTVPSLTISAQLGGVATYSIRGLVAGAGATSPTTGVYLDDIPLQKRNGANANQANGTPTPPIFDLERVEVLRGPQGTLYGGSSEGGTVRFISPDASISRYSAYGRTEVSSTEYGSPSYEGGVAVGGPIVVGKLGFRASVYDRHTGGYIDIVNPYNNGTVRYKDANASDDKSLRLAVRWDATDRFSARFSYFLSEQSQESNTNSYVLPINGTITTPSVCYNRIAATTVSTVNPSTPVPCPAGPIPVTMFQRPAVTYGPFNYLSKPFQSFDRAEFPTDTKFQAPSLTRLPVSLVIREAGQQLRQRQDSSSRKRRGSLRQKRSGNHHNDRRSLRAWFNAAVHRGHAQFCLGVFAICASRRRFI